VEHYDLGGIDPHENPGVYKFKRQTGARPIEFLGEWDWATSSWLRWLGNWAIWRRDSVKRRAIDPEKSLSARKGKLVEVSQ